MVFSEIDQAAWDWNKQEQRWRALRRRHALTCWRTGTRSSANNVIVQMVKVTESEIDDVTGAPVARGGPDRQGQGDAVPRRPVFAGTWERASWRTARRSRRRTAASSCSTPGNTWIELCPSGGGFVEATLTVSK